MRTSARTIIVALVPACIAIMIAVATGVAWVGQPLRLVQLLTLIGVSMVAGVSWAQAIRRLRGDRSERLKPPETGRPHPERLAPDAGTSDHSDPEHESS